MAETIERLKSVTTIKQVTWNKLDMEEFNLNISGSYIKNNEKAGIGD